VATTAADEGDPTSGAPSIVAGKPPLAAGEERAAPDPSVPAEGLETPPERPVDTELAGPPAAPTSSPAPEFRLTAISTRDGEPIALLNDRLVREGDRFGGVRIIRIGATEVEIEVDGERRTIGF
jgi:hypothetical protein